MTDPATAPPPTDQGSTQVGPKSTPLTIPYAFAIGLGGGAGAGIGFGIVMAVMEMMK